MMTLNLKYLHLKVETVTTFVLIDVVTLVQWSEKFVSAWFTGPSLSSQGTVY